MGACGAGRSSSPEENAKSLNEARKGKEGRKRGGNENATKRQEKEKKRKKSEERDRHRHRGKGTLSAHTFRLPRTKLF